MGTRQWRSCRCTQPITLPKAALRHAPNGRFFDAGRRYSAAPISSHDDVLRDSALHLCVQSAAQRGETHRPKSHHNTTHNNQTTPPQQQQHLS
mmetsp:Transcript_10832/g.31052  ORF Transcript_10832/g.31052 Transcript_10832/m.31052 type:complete len:93 (-) Transcript_10832:257-535(-)